MPTSSSKRIVVAACAVLLLAVGVWLGLEATTRRGAAVPVVSPATPAPGIKHAGAAGGARAQGATGPAPEAAGVKEPAAVGARGEKGVNGRDAARLFADGARLIAQNRVEDSFSSWSLDDLERGIAEVQEALRLGLPEKKEALKVLVDGYNGIATDPKRSPAALARLQELYRDLQEVDPEEPRWAIELSEITEDPAEQKAVLRKSIERNPQSYELRQVYGALLCEAGEKGAAMAQYVEAARVMSPAEAKEFGASLISHAAECMGPAGGSAYRTVYDVVETKSKEATRSKPGGEPAEREE